MDAVAERGSLDILAYIETQNMQPIERTVQILQQANGTIFSELITDLNLFITAIRRNDIENAQKVQIRLKTIVSWLIRLLKQDNEDLMQFETRLKQEEEVTHHMLKQEIKSITNLRETKFLKFLEKDEFKEVKALISYVCQLLDVLNRIWGILVNSVPRTWNDYTKELEEEHSSKINKLLENARSYIDKEIKEAIKIRELEMKHQQLVAEMRKRTI